MLVEMRSLNSTPSVPGPEYFDAGCMKVTKASKVLSSISHFIPEGWTIVYLYVLTPPYPSTITHAGGRMYSAGKSVIGFVHPAKSVLPHTRTWIWSFSNN